MKNTTKFGPTTRLDDSFAHLAHASAAASASDADFDFDNEDESDAEDDEEFEDDTEDDSEDDEEFEDEGDDEGDDESDAEDDDTYEEEIDADDEDDTFEEVIADDEDEDEDTFEEVIADDEFEGEDDSEDEDAPSEAEVIASLEAQGLCFVIASSEDEILESDMAEAVASLEDDEFEEVLADDEFEDEDEDESADDEFEDEDEDESGDDEFEDDAEDDVDSEDDEEFEDEDEDESGDEEFEDEDEDESDADEDEFEIESDDEGDDEEEVEADEEFIAPVATEEFLASATADDVTFHLTDDPQNPVLNVIVASVPAARITLASFGAQASEMADIFRTERYQQGLRTAMASQGVLNLLKKARAEFYATAYRSTDIFEEAVASAESVSKEQVAVAMAGLREDFVDAIQLVSAGMDKNFFQIENPLKRALYINMANAGVRDPMGVIEASFSEASAAHFEAVVEKAVEIMDKSVEAREEIRAAIGESGVIGRSAGAAHASAIATASVEEDESSAVAIAREVGLRHTVSASSKIEQKDQIRGLFNQR